MIAVGDNVTWVGASGLNKTGIVKEVVGPNVDGVDELKVQCQGGPSEGEIVLLTVDQVMKPDAPGPTVGDTTGASSSTSTGEGDTKSESHYRGVYRNIYEQAAAEAEMANPLRRYVTQPDPADGHVHIVMLDAEGDGVTDDAMGAKNYSHGHSVVSFEVLPATGTDVVSTHPGAPVASEVEEEPMDYAAEPVVAPAAPPVLVNPAADLPMESRLREQKEGEGEMTKAEKKKKKEADKEEEMKKESYGKWLNKVLFEEEAMEPEEEVPVGEEPPVVAPEDGEEIPPAAESFWDRCGLWEEDGAATPIAPTADATTTKGGGDNEAVDPPKTTAVPDVPATKGQDPIKDTPPSPTVAGHEVEGEQPLPAGAKANAVESAVQSVLRGTSARMAARKLISESAEW